jgi:type IV pilus assembly protein PilV
VTARARKSGARGYTVVEVMMAMAVLAVGASGVAAMQKATLLANVNARNLATANAIAEGWMERVRTDALAWNTPGGANDINDTRWIQLAAVGSPTTGGGWFTPLETDFGAAQPEGAAQADIMGAPIHPLTETPDLVPAFCTQLRLSRFAANAAAPAGQFERAVRVEVRVIWDRRGRPLTCGAWDADFEAQIGTYGSVYLVSAVLKNRAPI